jgi:hypothetical protein
MASGGHGGERAPGACVTTHIGLILGKSVAVNTRPCADGGTTIEAMCAWA